MKDYSDLFLLRRYLKQSTKIEFSQKPHYETIKDSLRVIQCKNISDDFYSNLLDWKNKYIFYVATNIIYRYNFYTEKCHSIFSSSNHTFTSIKFHSQSNKLCLGTSSGFFYIVDVETGKYTKHIYHKSRVGILETYNNNIITGSKDRKCKIIDLRLKLPVASFGLHMQEVCGLGINKTKYYLATGGNDNNVFIFDMRMSPYPMLNLKSHTAAVKALSWSQNYADELVTGGGAADKTIKHWNITNKTPLVKSFNFESQICNLKWLQNNKILGTFGYSNDDIKLFDNFKIKRCYKGHKNRVIYFSVEKEEKYFASGSSDSTIRIWNIESKKNTDSLNI